MVTIRVLEGLESGFLVFLDLLECDLDTAINSDLTLLEGESIALVSWSKAWNLCFRASHFFWRVCSREVKLGIASNSTTEKGEKETNTRERESKRRNNEGRNEEKMRREKETVMTGKEVKTHNAD